MLQTIQILGRVFFRAYVVAMLTLLWDNKAFYGLPFGLLVGYLSEFNNLIEVNKKNKKKDEDVEEKEVVKPTFEDNWSDQIPLEIPKFDYETLRRQVEHSLRVGKDMNYGNYNIAGLILSDLKLYIEKNSNKQD